MRKMAPPWTTPAPVKQRRRAGGSRSFIGTSLRRWVGQRVLVGTTASREDAALRGASLSFPESVISRAEWGAVPPKSRAELDGPARKAVVHHTALAKCSGLSGCRDLLRSIQRFHMDERGFDDIGYK